MITLLQAGYYAEPHAARYDAATMGMFVLIIAIGVIGFIVQARLQSVFKKYSKVQFPGGLTGADIAEAIAWAAQLPAHMNVNDMVLMPSQQAGAYYTHRKTKQTTL